MDFLELAAKRYSLRRYADKPVEEEKVAKILQAARIAPTGHNNQCQRVYVLKSENAMTIANAVSPFMFGALMAFVVCYDTLEDWHHPEEPDVHVGEIDASIVATHMILEAAELGLGTCLVGKFQHRKIHELLEMPESVVPVVMIPCGYPTKEAHPSHFHDEFRPDEEWIFER